MPDLVATVRTIRSDLKIWQDRLVALIPKSRQIAAMANDTYQALADGLIRTRADDLGITSLDEAFMSVAHEQVLLRYDLSKDEIDAGLTDGSLDGQIDAMYVIVNGASLVGEEGEEIPDKGPLDVDIILIQSKNTKGFEENPLKIIRATISDLLDLSKTYDGYISGYSHKLQDLFAVARRVLFETSGRSLRVTATIFYVTKASTSAIHETVQKTAETLKDQIGNAAGTKDVGFEFVGAEELIALSRLPRTRKKRLENHKVVSSSSADSFACLTTIGAFVDFLTDDHGGLTRSFFDANVRDFLGKSEVNEAIKKTLHDLDEGDFWWFNNGITIVASDIDQKGEVLTLTDPLIVNGLQTSNVIYGFMTDASVESSVKDIRRKQLLLVKIIQPSSEKARDEVIRATNSQTHIPKAYLRGMDHVHRNIEDHLKGKGLYYERRKNQYRIAGKKVTEIVTLSEMAQALMAAILFRPADARGRPTTLLKSDDDYVSLFSDKYPLDTFLNIILAKRQIAARLVAHDPTASASFKNDVIFHILAYLSAAQFKASSQAAHMWKAYMPSSEEFDAAIFAVIELFNEAGGTDKIAKSASFQNTVIETARKSKEEADAADAELTELLGDILGAEEPVI